MLVYMEGEAREGIGCMSRFSRCSPNLTGFSVLSATEIQNIQLGDGNVIRDLTIPIYMVFPRLFTCATTATKTFKVGTIV